MPLTEFVRQLNKWCVGLDELWCQGPLFDYAILQNFYAPYNRDFEEDFKLGFDWLK